MPKLTEDTLRWAVAHTCTNDANNIFPSAFEFQAIADDGDELIEFLGKQHLRQWQSKPYRLMLTPKHRYGFRQSTQLDPRDAIVYAGLVYEIASDLEAYRVCREDRRVFSYRFAPSENGRLYETDWSGFQQTSREMLEEWPSYDYVLTADIADFYPRLGHHPLDNALKHVTKRSAHVAALRKLLSQWSAKNSYGIPVGPAPSALLAEIALHEVDSALLVGGFRFVRYVDDYRVFANSQSEAYRALQLLAETLFENHGLTLQQHKTRIHTAGEFRDRVLQADATVRLDGIADRVNDLLDRLGLGNPYESIDYDELDDVQRALVNALDLDQMLEEELEREEPDVTTLRFLLRRLAQIGGEGALHLLEAPHQSLYPVFSELVRYAQSLTHLEPNRRNEIGYCLLDLLSESACVATELPFHRLWIASTFGASGEWGNQPTRLLSAYESSGNDDDTRRELVIALSRASQAQWFATQRRQVPNMSPWLRRAFLYGASCLPRDRRKHFYLSMRDRCDELDRLVMAWAPNHPPA